MVKDCLVIIPARGGSKGIPKKNLALINGIPLIEFTIKAALDSALPGRICLTTDNDEIRAHGLQFPIEAPFLRPADLSQDNSGTIPVVKHTLDWYEKNSIFQPEIIMLLQPTCPFRSALSIRQAYKDFIATSADSLISVNAVSEHPCEYVMKTESGFRFVLTPPEQPGRQHFPEVFFINGAIYMTTVDFFRTKETLFNKKARLFIMPQEESIDIDTPMDLEYAKWLYKRKRRSMKS